MNDCRQAQLEEDAAAVVNLQCVCVLPKVNNFCNVQIAAGSPFFHFAWIAKRHKYLGIIAESVSSAGYFVSASEIADFIPPEFRF
jgi:hypothetical protein